MEVLEQILLFLQEVLQIIVLVLTLVLGQYKLQIVDLGEMALMPQHK